MNGSGAGPADERERALCEELLSYLREHPRAMDSLEGIAEWWLPRHQIRVGVERIVRALEVLTEAGQVEQVPEGERTLYRLHRREGEGEEGGSQPGAGS